MLDQHLPPTDDPNAHADRIKLHHSGAISFWLALADAVPVGHLVVRWGGFQFGELPRLFPGTPVLAALRVWPPQHWGRGIATHLLTIAEQAAHDRGYLRIGLGVEVSNERARRLYSQLGYHDWGAGALTEQVTRLDGDGRTAPYDETFTVMTKQLRQA